MKKSKPKDKKLAQKRERKAKRRKTRLSNGEHNYSKSEKAIKLARAKRIIKANIVTKKLTLWEKIKKLFTKK